MAITGPNQKFFPVGSSMFIGCIVISVMMCVDLYRCPWHETVHVSNPQWHPLRSVVNGSDAWRFLLCSVALFRCIVWNSTYIQPIDYSDTLFARLYLAYQLVRPGKLWPVLVKIYSWAQIKKKKMLFAAQMNEKCCSCRKTPCVVQIAVVDVANQLRCLLPEAFTCSRSIRRANHFRSNIC